MNRDEYLRQYNHSISNKEIFFEKCARELISWDLPFQTTYNDNISQQEWFKEGSLNACYNCVDRNASRNPKKIAIVFDSNEGETETFTYADVQHEVIHMSNVLEQIILNDKIEQNPHGYITITIYMPMSPHALFCALACARLGYPHNVVFGGYNANSLEKRVLDCKSQLIVTTDFAFRGLKKVDYLQNALMVKGIRILVIENDKIAYERERRQDVLYFSDFPLQKCFIPCKSVSSEHHLFYLYTSGSTGNPKGIVHTTGGYLTYAALSFKTLFPDGPFCCTADIGWITGHTYALYGPLLNNATLVITGGYPTFPSKYRYFEIIDKYRIATLYTAPTIIRMLKGQSIEDRRSDYDLSCLKALGCVGEPIGTSAFKWFQETFSVGKTTLPVIDTYWQTEAGGVLCSPIVDVSLNFPESCGIPLLGVEPVILDDYGKLCNEGEIGKIYFKGGWPGVCRDIIGDTSRYKSDYFGSGMYYTGDEGSYTNEGEFRYYFVKGRADDVINDAGHRISTAEVESVCNSIDGVTEAASVGISDDIRGEAVVIFVVSKIEYNLLFNLIKQHLRDIIGPVVSPRELIVVDDIPKTRTGKIMRRILKCLLSDSDIGDISTCGNIESIELVKNAIKAHLHKP